MKRNILAAVFTMVFAVAVSSAFIGCKPAEQPAPPAPAVEQPPAAEAPPAPAPEAPKKK